MPHRLHRNVASSIQLSLRRLSEHLAHQELPSACRPPQREVPDFLPSRSHALLPRERAQEVYSLDRDRRQTKMSLNLAIPLRESAFEFERCRPQFAPDDAGGIEPFRPRGPIRRFVAIMNEEHR